MEAQRVVVAGAGLGGLTAALALAQRGHAVEVLEQAREAAPIGAGVTLAPNAMRVYAHLGLAETIAAAGIEPARQRVQHWRDDATLVTLERGARMREFYGAAYVYIHRARLHAILTEALARVGDTHLRLNARVVGAEVAADGVEVALDGGERVPGDLLVGADGVKSAVRTLFESPPPRFTGHVCWRALVPTAGEPVLQGLADFPGIHIGPGRMIARYPVDAATLNLVFFARQDGWAEEGWTIPAARRELEQTFAGWSAQVGAMIAAIDEAALCRWAVFARTPLADWSKGGRVVLLGDAAHAMTPFLGQGAACAIEDALVLARALEAATALPEALARYQAARRPRCDLIQAESNANADRLQGEAAELYGLTRLRNEETLGLFAYDAGAVAV